MQPIKEQLNQPVKNVIRKDTATLPENIAVHQALDLIRHSNVGERIVYFYVTNEAGELAGVLPTRRLLTSPVESQLSDIMIRKVVALPETATVMEACEAFVLHKFLALPVVDSQRRPVGVVDIDLLTTQVFNIAETEQVEELFEMMGFEISQVREASPAQAFRYRFPWLVATIGSGTVCAMLASAYEVTLAKSMILAFFMTLVLGLGESVCIQSMTITIQALHAVNPTLRWYWSAFWRELGTSVLLGIGSGLLVGIIVWLWRGAAMEAFSIGASIFLTLCVSCFFGLSVPAALHAMKLDPKIAAGPASLALTDIVSLLFYLTLGSWLL